MGHDGGMKGILTAAGAALLLVSCGGAPGMAEFTLEADSVAFPATVGATDSLAVDVSVTLGGCQSFKRFEAQRTANTLSLRVVGQEPAGQKVACPAVIVQETHTYTDPGTPARTGPFEVIVNGTSWGEVEVR